MGFSEVPVAVLMGSESDRDVVAPALAVLDELEVGAQWRVLSAHRTPGAVADFAREAKAQGISVIIAAAGGAAHLAGVVAAWTTLPVIALPIASKSTAGLDSLLSMVQMPPGIPVATVGVDAARNAGLLAAAILAVSDAALAERLEAFRQRQAARVLESDRRLAASRHVQGGAQA